MSFLKNKYTSQRDHTETRTIKEPFQRIPSEVRCFVSHVFDTSGPNER